MIHHPALVPPCRVCASAQVRVLFGDETTASYWWFICSDCHHKWSLPKSKIPAKPAGLAD
jgi:hypothetical protein